MVGWDLSWKLCQNRIKNTKCAVAEARKKTIKYKEEIEIDTLFLLLLLKCLFHLKKRKNLL